MWRDRADTLHASTLAFKEPGRPESFAPSHAHFRRQFLGANESSDSLYRGAPRRPRLTIARRAMAPRNDTTKLAALKLL